MEIELSVSGERPKRRVLAALAEAGYQSRSGAIRLAHPFSVCVEDVNVTQAEAVRELVVGVDPGAAVVMGATPALAD